MGSGYHTFFWEDPWLEIYTLKEKFPSFFSISLQQKSLVGEIGIMVSEILTRDLKWRRDFFLRKLPNHEELKAFLREVIISLYRYN